MAVAGCTGGCDCREAVVTAYRELTARRCSDCRAMRCCVQLYRLHHGEEPVTLAQAQVRQWIEAAALPLPSRRRVRA